MRGLQGTSETTKLVVSICLLAAFLELGRWIWPETSSHPVDRFFEGNTISVLGVRRHLAPGHHHRASPSWWRSACASCSTGRAAASPCERRSTTAPLAALNGARPDRSAMLAWAIGCSLAALAGILIARRCSRSAAPSLTLLIVNAYAAAMFGRLRSLPLTFVGALDPRAAPTPTPPATSRTETSTSAGFRLAVPAIILFIVLLVLPEPAAARPHARCAPARSSPRPPGRGTLIASGGRGRGRAS